MSELADQLAQADRAFGRPAVPIVFAEYEAFMVTGEFPYNAVVITTIARKHGVPDDGQHGQLGHEVYLASRQYKGKKLQRQEQELAERGYAPITGLEPVAGMKIELGSSDRVYRLVKATNDWALLAPRKRTRGISLRGLQLMHRNYETAKKQGFTSNAMEQVHMYKVVNP